MQWQVHTIRGISFDRLEKLQAEAVARVGKTSSRPELILAECLPTFTAGKSALPADLLLDSSELSRRQISVAQVARGGKWTYHGPGQLIAYPIINLEAFGFGIRGVKPYLSCLKSAVSDHLRKLGVPIEVSEDRPFGIYCQNRKLTSFGVGIERAITVHGMALYLSSQQTPFSGIIACGESNAEAPISLTELGISVDWYQHAQQLADHIKRCLIPRVRGLSKEGSIEQRLN